MPTVFVVEDDEIIRDATRLGLERRGFTVRTAENGLDALDMYREIDPDIILLDVMLPELDGISVCRRIREVSTVPILMVTARADAVDVVQGLEAGADDYVTKPFDMQVLAARISAVARRAANRPAPTGEAEYDSPGEVQTFGDLWMNRDTLEVKVGGQAVRLTPTETRLLLELSATPGRIVARVELLERVWGYSWGGDSRTVDTHVVRLRRKIGAAHVETVREFGYRLR